MADESQGKPAIPVFFAFYAIDIHANEFHPTNKAAFFLYHKVKTYLSSLLLEEQT